MLFSATELEPGDSYIASHINTEGGDEVINIPTGTNLSPYYKKETKDCRIFMDGQETFKFAVSTMAGDISRLAEEANVSLGDIKYIVPHQANVRIIQYASKRLKIPMEKFFVNIQNYGNTSAASIAIALDELNRTKGIEKGDLIIMTAFGGGLSSGSCLIKW